MHTDTTEYNSECALAAKAIFRTTS